MSNIYFADFCQQFVAFRQFVLTSITSCKGEKIAKGRCFKKTLL